MGYSIPTWRVFDIEYAGVNHFAFITKLEYKGEDMYPKLREHAHSLITQNFKNRGYNYYLLEKYGWFPYPGSRHIAEFLPDYYNEVAGREITSGLVLSHRTFGDFARNLLSWKNSGFSIDKDAS